MSDFVPSELLPDLWEEILNRHWHFLETEDSQQKFEEQKKLEVCLKEFLCIVPHDRKFFLPETAQVLKQSVRDLDNFTANKAIIGFEAISQYANNLFTKPWRKEFRILKTYSGFFQHEIKSNLVNAVKLFEAMGYRRLSDEILILDGPICPDQVTNVSRDAMAAYMECQIMKHIYAGLTALGIKIEWQDIFQYREKHIGGTSKAIKSLAYAIQERRHHKEKAYNDNSYAQIHAVPPAPPPPPQALHAQCPSCATTSQYHHKYITPTTQQPCALHGSNLIQTGCALHPTKVSLMCNGSGSGNKMYTSYPTAAASVATSARHAAHSHIQNIGAAAAAPTAHMSHSRSLEHYNEPPPLLPHRHSFDHQQQGCSSHHHQQQQQGHYQVPRSAHYALPQHLYESPYDCIDAGLQGDDSIDGGSSVSYAAVTASNTTHPYNVSGNRYPLPYNISNQLNSTHYSTPAAVTCNGVNGIDYGANENAYATVTKPTHSCGNLGYYSSQQLQHSPRLMSAFSTGGGGSKDFQAYRQRSFPPDQLIDFDDRALLTTHDYNAHQHMQLQRNLERDNFYQHQQDQRRSRREGLNPTYAEPKDILSQQQRAVANTSSDDAYVSSLYARPVPRSSRLKDSSGGGGGGSGALLAQNTKQTTDKYLRKMDLIQDYQVDNNRKLLMELNEHNKHAAAAAAAPRHKLSSHSNERDFSDMSYDSLLHDDFVHVARSEHPQRSPTQAVKNQDGVGSFESWDFVFQNLDRSGYKKDLGERGDLLVNSLDLDALNLGTGSSGGGVGNVDATTSSSNTNQSQNVDKQQRRTLNNNQATSETKPSGNDEKLSKAERLASMSSMERLENNKTTTTTGTTKQARTASILKTTNNTATNSATSGVANNKKTKSALKTTTATTTATDHSKTNGNTTTIARNIKRQSSSSGGGAKPTPPTVSVSKPPNEWSCRFCTYLNPDTVRICGMCAHSKDFNLEATVSNTPTCV